MCRNIKTLHNFKPPATEEEILFTRPSKVNEAAFNYAVDEVTRAATELLESLVTSAQPRSRSRKSPRANRPPLPRSTRSVNTNRNRFACFHLNRTRRN